MFLLQILKPLKILTKRFSTRVKMIDLLEQQESPIIFSLNKPYIKKGLVNIPNARGLLMKLYCIFPVLTATKISEPYWLFRSLTNWTSWGLYKSAARWRSAAHCPFLPRIASSAGTHPNGPVPVTKTLLAPRSYSFCNMHKLFKPNSFS